MTNTFTGSESIGSIVAAFAGAGSLFKQHRIDFCCGGDRPLNEVLDEKKIEQAAFLAELNSLYASMLQRADRGEDYRSYSSSDLIDHVVEVHHGYLNRELPALSQFVTKILRVHGQAHPELLKVHQLFHQVKMELEQHMIEEEEIVFPLIKQCEGSGSPELLAQTAEAIAKLEADHSSVGDMLREIREVTSDYLLPEGACRTYTLTFQQLIELESDMFQHIHLENNIIFPRYCPNCAH